MEFYSGFGFTSRQLRVLEGCSVDCGSRLDEKGSKVKMEPLDWEKRERSKEMKRLAKLIVGNKKS